MKTFNILTNKYYFPQSSWLPKRLPGLRALVPSFRLASLRHFHNKIINLPIPRSYHSNYRWKNYQTWIVCTCPGNIVLRFRAQNSKPRITGTPTRVFNLERADWELCDHSRRAIFRIFNHDFVSWLLNYCMGHWAWLNAERKRWVDFLFGYCR